MPDNLLQEKSGKEEGDLDLRLKAKKMLAKLTDDESTNVVGKRIIGDRDSEELRQ